MAGDVVLLAPVAISTQEAAVPQRLLAQFPTQINSENISKNRDFLANNREFHLRKSLSALARIPSSTSALHSDQLGLSGCLSKDFDARVENRTDASDLVRHILVRAGAKWRLLV